MLRAQVAYMLINQTGPAMQPGPRNYNRSFIRDGSATAAVLLRMGQAKVARDYLSWYADHAVHENGLVSPILNEDGSVEHAASAPTSSTTARASSSRWSPTSRATTAARPACANTSRR